MERISVYIDGANFYHGVKSISKKYSDFYFNFADFIEKITKGKKLVDVYYFNAPLKQQLNPDTYAKQQFLFTRLERIGYEIILCKRKKKDLDDGTQKHVIKEDDIRLALQMQKDAYANKFDIAYLFSGDGDFAPLAEYLKEKSKKIKVFYFKASGSLSLLQGCEMNCEIITKKTLNKYFDREATLEWLEHKKRRQ